MMEERRSSDQTLTVPDEEARGQGNRQATQHDINTLVRDRQTLRRILAFMHHMITEHRANGDQIQPYE